MSGRDDGFVAGQVHGLIGLVLALAGTHPEPALLLLHLDAAENVALAAVEPTAVSDAFLEGSRDTVSRARSILLKRLAADEGRLA